MTAIEELKWFISDGLDNFDESIKVSEIWEKINELSELEKNQKVYNKQETLEEFAKRITNENHFYNYKSLMQLVIMGAKWQQEQDKNKYSEDEVFRLLVHSNERHGKRSVTTQCIKTWFEQFKNK
jgi:2,4-dienoyl-CoA reductase-like NADH-dependent reductase (Old Yellow Enzyme family)